MNQVPAIVSKRGCIRADTVSPVIIRSKKID